jgi:hypothetical protein
MNEGAGRRESKQDLLIILAGNEWKIIQILNRFS